MNKRQSRINKGCAYYPCHDNLEDCTFCFCLLYPCLDEVRGRYVFSKKQKKRVWSCRDCSWIHQREVVDNILELTKKAWEIENREQPASRCCRGLAKGGKTGNRKKVREGVVILSHGSRREKANTIVRDIIEKVKVRTKLKYIEAAHLQFSGLTLQKSIKELAGKGCKRIIVLPFFLLSGNHVRRDIPRLLEEEGLKYPDIQFTCTEPLGSDERICEIVAERIQNAGTY